MRFESISIRRRVEVGVERTEQDWDPVLPDTTVFRPVALCDRELEQPTKVETHAGSR